MIGPSQQSLLECFKTSLKTDILPWVWASMFAQVSSSSWRMGCCWEHLHRLLELHKCPWPLSRSRGRGHGGWSSPLCLSCQTCTFHLAGPFLPVQHSQRSCWPQPRGSRREAASREDKAGPLTERFNLLFNTCTRCVFQATPGVEKGGELLGVGSGHSRATNPDAGRRPTKDWRAPSQELDGLRFFLNLGGDTLEVVAGTALACMFCCMGGWYSLSPSCPSIDFPLPSLPSLSGSHRQRCAHSFQATETGIFDWTVRLIA